ncbi:hypothetical protein [Adhaeribacter arboris]|nr:hypothetical protein [Adhaeribacter arboris]
MKKPLLRTSTRPLALCLGLLSFLSSCEKKEDTPALEVKPTTCLPSKNYNAADPTQYTTFQYDDLQRLTRISDYVKGKESRASIYEYNAQGQVGRITITDEALSIDLGLPDKVYMIYTFDYNSLGQVSKYSSYKPWLNNSYALEETTCEYDSEGNRTKTTTTTDNGANSFTTVYTYKDGNCIQRDINQGPSPVGPTFYQYDLSKENKLRSFNQKFSLMHLTGPTASKNMSAESTQTNADPQHNSTYKQTYEYNEHGYPTKVNDTWKNFFNSGTTVIAMEYVCQ